MWETEDPTKRLIAISSVFSPPPHTVYEHWGGVNIILIEEMCSYEQKDSENTLHNMYPKIPIHDINIPERYYRVEWLMRDWNKNNDKKIDITNHNVELYAVRWWTLKEISEGKELYILSPDLQSHCPGIITNDPIDINIE